VATPLTFTYTAGGDLLKKSKQGKDMTRVSDTLAVDDPNIVNTVFIHANSDVVAKQGSTNVSANWAIFRMKRVWQRPLGQTPSGGDPIGGPTGPYEEAKGSRRMYTDTTERAAGDWVDCVGWVLPTRVDYYERTLHEFAVGAQDAATHKVRDDSGGFYVIVVIDLSPEWYRVRMSEAVTLTSAQWKATRGTGPGTSPIPNTTPFKTEATTGAQAIAWAPDDGWQAWGTYNEQLLAPVTHP
jgi:hypothetical protein